jgi:hypothetical protein
LRIVPSYRGATKAWGYRSEDGIILPVVEALAWILGSRRPEPIKPGHAFIQNTDPHGPAVLALQTALEDGASDLLVEILDDHTQRKWSEDDRLLVEQVADQLH